MKTFEIFDKFEKRHIGPNEHEIKLMLDETGVESVDQLIDETIPAHIRLKEPLPHFDALTENGYLEYLRNAGKKNIIAKSYIGMGYYPTVTPAVILRNILENPGWYTQYTPYQAEIAQGRLEALMNFQTMVSDLTALPIANASLLDEGTAASEAMLMLFANKTNKSATKFFVDIDIFPQTLEVLRTRAIPKNIELVSGDFASTSLDDSYFGLILQYPSGKGEVKDYSDFISKAKALNISSVVATDLMSLALLTPPGEFGADVAVGSSQRFGVPMGFGGPHAAFFACSDKYKRVIPGRIIGASTDSAGNLAFRMALQTREQHIRREKATSNICTAQVLLAITASMYAVYHGAEGIRQIASRIHSFTGLLDLALKDLGFKQTNTTYFDTLHIEMTPAQAAKLRTESESLNLNFRWFENGNVGISLHQTTKIMDLIEIISAFTTAFEMNDFKLNLSELKDLVPEEYSAPFARTSEYLTHPVFKKYHSETEFLRYVKKLENKDLSLAHSMIPLGSCTMKLNATSEMIGITLPEFASIHPFAPAYQVEGYRQIIDDLSAHLADITGFPGVSLQPNSGAQGEYAGLMVIREYHLSRGDLQRNVVLIPSSAHGTNPASAVMAGMSVVVVNCDDHGNIEMEDLKAKAEQNKDVLAALMVTYPSTHGVFEESIIEICEVIHKFGGQVYMDGANMNAQVGLTSPATIGADVCHLNLHKTFAIPHGGGGPGVGPICCAEQLKPFLPSHSVVKTGGENGVTAISAAPFGSALILVISLGYIKMLGSEGITNATKIAILNANYIKSKLDGYYKTLYSGKNGRVAHEMILDMREFKHSAHIEVEDMAKRLMDYSFHAPTVSFPVAGTLMVEPTESESLYELDRFINAMIAIREEIAEIEKGIADVNDNVLKNSPHTQLELMTDDWNHSYSREKAAFPIPSLKAGKFWPTVKRINSALGDRNLVCTCTPIEEYM
ncbi:MAG: aminomethyl-transferring glycine dehydrogenase [Ignavibacteria bacterium]|nr:aminomethyl-transferring glycine dehydrogenase [Ignavibacteria bacterium]